MFVKNSSQLSLFEGCTAFPEPLQKRLRSSWAEVFRNDVLVHIPEDAFAHLYADGKGRPNVPVALLVGLSLIKELRNLTDSQMFEALHFDLLVQHALAIAPGEGTFSERTMYTFRERVAGDAATQATFDTITARLRQTLGLRTDVQRLDSTQVSSNMVHLSRLGLFVQTIERFLVRLQKSVPERVTALPEALQQRYLERQGYFADTTGPKSRRRLEQAARDLAGLVERFAGDDAVRHLASYRVLVRLFHEQCELRLEGADPVAVPKDPKEIRSDSLQAPSDPDATYSRHKGKGYQVQIAETCHPDNPVELITHVAVEGAHESDQHALLPFLEATAERGITPQTVLADTAYSGGENLIAAAERGVELLAPTPGTVDPDDLTLVDFAITEDTLEVLHCPEGHAPTRQYPNRKGDGQIARFDRQVCAACECKDSCPAGKPDDATLRFTLADYALALSRVRQETAEFKQAYKQRSGIEATNAALKTAHGLAKLWARGRPRVTFAVLMKALALNVKRYARVQCARMASAPC